MLLDYLAYLVNEELRELALKSVALHEASRQLYNIYEKQLQVCLAIRDLVKYLYKIFPLLRICNSEI